MKQFDEEYKEYLRHEAPDLWDRIEAGVDERIHAESRKRQTKKKKQAYRYVKFAASAAACVAALLLAVPVLRYIKGAGFTKQVNDEASAAADTTMEDTQKLASQMFDTAGQADMAAEDMAAEEVPQAEAAEEAAAEEILYEGDDETMMQAEMPSPQENTQQSEQQESALLSAQPQTPQADAAAGEEAALDGLSDSEDTQQVSVRVLEQEQTDGVVYTVEILEDSGGVFVRGQIWKVTAAKEQEALETEKTYKLVLCSIAAGENTAALKDVR